MIRGIILDMGGVVLRGKTETVLRRVAEDFKVDESQLAALFKEYQPRLQVGAMKLSDFFEIFKNKFNFQREDVAPQWRSAYLSVMKINEELMKLIPKLKEKYKVGVITNVNDFHFQLNEERKIYQRFDEAIVSCEVGLAKPDRKIFELALERMGLKPEECVFVDDREGHIGVPEIMGFQVIHFTGTSGLLVSLRKLGVEI